VTSDTGFLGSLIVRRLRERGCRQILATGIEHGDLTDPALIGKHLDFKPDQFNHLAAMVGGIGANRERPAEFFHQNLMMGVQLMQPVGWQGRQSSSPLVLYAPTAFKEENLWDGYPEETNAP